MRGPEAAVGSRPYAPTMTSKERPISRTDYERVYILLQAHQVRDVANGEALWEVLHRIHQDELNGRLLDPAEVVGDEGAARESHHVELVLDSLMKGKSTVPAETKAPLQVCGTPGCPELTHGSLCLSCELQR